MLKFCKECKRVIASVLLCLTLVGSFVSNPIVALADKKEEATTKGSGGKDDTAENRIQQNFKMHAGEAMTDVGVSELSSTDVEAFGTFLSNFFIPFDTEVAKTDEKGITNEAKTNRQATFNYLTKVLTDQMYFESSTATNVVNAVLGASYSSATELTMKCTYTESNGEKSTTSSKEYKATFYDFLMLIGGGVTNLAGFDNIKDKLTKVDLIFKKGGSNKKAFTMKFDKGSVLANECVTAFLSYYSNIDLSNGIGSNAIDADRTVYDLKSEDGCKKLVDDLGSSISNAGVTNWKMYVDCFGNILVNCGNGRRFIVLPACANPYRFRLRDGNKTQEAVAGEQSTKIINMLTDAEQYEALEEKIKKEYSNKGKTNMETCLKVAKSVAKGSQFTFDRCYLISTELCTSYVDIYSKLVKNTDTSIFEKYYANNVTSVSSYRKKDLPEGRGTYGQLMDLFAKYFELNGTDLTTMTTFTGSDGDNVKNIISAICGVYGGDKVKKYFTKKAVRKKLANIIGHPSKENNPECFDGDNYKYTSAEFGAFLELWYPSVIDRVDLNANDNSGYQVTIRCINEVRAEAIAKSEKGKYKQGASSKNAFGQTLVFENGTWDPREVTSSVVNGTPTFTYTDRDATYAIATLLTEGLLDAGDVTNNDKFKSGLVYNYTTLYNMTSLDDATKGNSFQAKYNDKETTLSVNINKTSLQKPEHFKLQRGTGSVDFDTKFFGSGSGGEVYEGLKKRAEDGDYLFEIAESSKVKIFTDGLKFPEFANYSTVNGGATSPCDGTTPYKAKLSNTVNSVIILDNKGTFKGAKDYKAVNCESAYKMATASKELKSAGVTGYSTTIGKVDNKIKNKVENAQDLLTGVSMSYMFAFYYDEGGRDVVNYKARKNYFPSTGLSDSFNETVKDAASGDTLQTEVLSLSYYFLHPTEGGNIVSAWFKNKVSSVLLKWHSDMTGASNAKATTGTTKYVSFTGYVTMPAIEDVSWLDTLMNYYNSLSVFFVIFMFIMMVLYIMAGSMTVQRGIVAVIIFAFCVMLPPQAIDAAVAVSNKFSETTYSEKFTYWALLQNESYLDELNKAESATDYTDYLLSQWKSQIMESNIAENLVDVRWMTPKKNNYSANIDKEVKETIQETGYWRILNGSVSAQISGEDYQRTANQLTLYRSYTDINSYSRYIYSNISTGSEDGKVTNSEYMKKIKQGNHESLASALKYTDANSQNGIIEAIKLGFNVDSGEHSGAKTGMKRFYGMTCSSAVAEQMNKVGKVTDTLTKVKENNFIGVNTDLYNWDLSNFNRQKDIDGKTLSSDTADIACFALMTESPYYFFSWNFYDQGEGKGENGFSLNGEGLKPDGSATGGYKNMLLGTQDYFYNNQIKSNIRGYGEVRDFLDMRSLFTVVIPYLKEANELYTEYGRQFGFNLYDEVEYRYDAEKWKEYEAIKDESERSQTLKKYWHNCNVSQLLDMYTPWVDVMYECDYALAETIEVAGKKYSVSDPLNPDTYPYKEGRPMIFSRSEMIYYGLNENNLTAVERKIINVTDKSLDDMFDLVNYYNFSDVVLNNAASMLTTFNFNKEFSQTSFASGTHELYPQSFELKNFNYDAFMRLILSNNTGESMTDNNSMAKVGDYTATEANKKAGNSNIYASITERSSILTPLMLIILDFMSIYIIPFFRFAFIILIFFMSIIMILGGMIRAEENMLKVAWKNLLSPLMYFLLVSCGMAFIVSLFMSNGYTGITGDSNFSISLGDPVMTIIAMILVDGIVIWLYFKLVKKVAGGVIKWGKVVLSSMGGAVGGALSNAVSGFTASRRAKSFGKAIGEGMRGGGSGSGGYGSGGSGGADAGDVNDRGNRNTKVGAGAVNFANMSTAEAPDGMSASEIEKDIADGKAKMENDTPQTKGFFGRRVENAKNRYDNFTDSVDRKVNNARRKVNNAKDYASATGREVAYGAKMVGKGAKALGSGAVAVGSAVGSKTKKAGLKASALGKKGANKVNSMKKSVVSNGFTKVNAFNRKRMNKRLEMYKHRDSLNPNAGFKSEATKALEAKIARAKARQANYAKGEIGIVKGVKTGAGYVSNGVKTKANHIKGSLAEAKKSAGIYATCLHDSAINKLGGKDKEIVDSTVAGLEKDMNSLAHLYGERRKRGKKGRIDNGYRRMPTLAEFDADPERYAKNNLTRDKLVTYLSLKDELGRAKEKQAYYAKNTFGGIVMAKTADKRRCMKNFANTTKAGAQAVYGSARDLTGKAVNTVAGATKTVVDGTRNTVRDATNTVKTGAKTVANSTMNFASDVAGSVVDGANTIKEGAKYYAGNVADDLAEEFAGLGMGIKNTASDIVDTVYENHANSAYEKLNARAEKKAQKELEKANNRAEKNRKSQTIKDINKR